MLIIPFRTMNANTLKVIYGGATATWAAIYLHYPGTKVSDLVPTVKVGYPVGDYSRK